MDILPRLCYDLNSQDVVLKNEARHCIFDFCFETEGLFLFQMLQLHRFIRVSNRLLQRLLRGQASVEKEKGCKSPSTHGTVSVSPYRSGESRRDESPPFQNMVLGEGRIRARRKNSSIA